MHFAADQLTQRLINWQTDMQIEMQTNELVGTFDEQSQVKKSTEVRQT